MADRFTLNVRASGSKLCMERIGISDIHIARANTHVSLGPGD